jgi:hypothetical protein
MKTAVFAAATLLGSVSAAIHKLPLKKVPLSEQLAGASIDSHVKHLGQKYMGIRPEAHAQEMFRDSSVHTEGGHVVPVSNFLNAQCQFFPTPSVDLSQLLTTRQISQRSPSARRRSRSRSSSIQAAPTSGFRRPSATPSPASCTPSTTPRPPPPSPRTAPPSRSSTAPAA